MLVFQPLQPFAEQTLNLAPYHVPKPSASKLFNSPTLTRRAAKPEQLLDSPPSSAMAAIIHQLR